MPDRICVDRVINAAAADIYALLTDPAGHVRIDGSGMLVETSHAAVTALEPDRLVEWSVSAEGRSPLGHVFGYRLEPVDETSTQVTSYCDWSGLNPKLVGKLAFPVVPASMMEQTLERLSGAVE